MILFSYFLSLFIYFVISYKVSFWQTNILMDNRGGCSVLFLEKNSFCHFFAALLFFISLSFPIIFDEISVYFIFLNLFLYFLKDHLSATSARNKRILELLPFFIEIYIEKGTPAEKININSLKKEIKDILENKITRNIKFKN